MSNTTRSFLALTKASLKMYFRNKGAVVFSMLLPIALMAIFGFLSKGSGNHLKIGLTNHAHNEVSDRFVKTLKEIQAFSIIEDTEELSAAELGKGNLDLQVIIPETFGTIENDKPTASTILTKYNKGKPQSGQVANMMITQIVGEFEKHITGSTTVLDVKSEGVTTNNLGYFDFILPGLLSMTIMQLGIFGVAFSFVAYKASGALRRIQATPVHPIYFVFAQAFTRLLVALMTSSILVGAGTYFFGFHMLGNYFYFTLVAIIGILIFLGIGFAIAGWAKDETHVAPVANLIQLPMLMLSGIFFSREGFPGWLRSVTDYFPLTYLSHGLRKIANEGASIADIPGDLVGMLVWLVVVYAIAIKLFKWE